MAKSFRIDIRHQALPGRRLNISAHTTNRKLRDQREAAVRTLIERGDMETIDLLRRRKLHVTEVQTAVRAGTVEQLIPKASDTAKLGPLVDALLKTVEATREPRTFLQYSAIGNALLEHFTPAARIRAVGKAEAEGFLHGKRERTGRPWSPTHQRQVATFAARIWRAAGVPEKANPWKLAERPRNRTKRQAFLQPSEWRDLEGHVRGEPVAAMLALGALAGLREGEVSNLRTGLDVDMDARVIRIQPRTGKHAWKPKTDNSVRTVPMSDALWTILRRHVVNGYAGERYFLRLPKQDRPTTEGTIIRWTERAFTRAGLRYGLKGDGLTNHSLRHTFATWLLLEKVPVHVVAALMGDTVPVVLATYAHLLVPDLEGAVKAQDKLLKEGE